MNLVFKQWSEKDVEVLCGTTKAVDLFHEGDDTMLKRVLYILGLQTSHPEFEAQLCQHRPLIRDNNDVIFGYLFTAPERTDEEWKNSGYASIEVKSPASQDSELNKDLRVMSHVPNFTLSAMKAAEKGERFEGEDSDTN